MLVSSAAAREGDVPHPSQAITGRLRAHCPAIVFPAAVAALRPAWARVAAFTPAAPCSWTYYYYYYYYYYHYYYYHDHYHYHDHNHYYYYYSTYDDNDEYYYHHYIIHLIVKDYDNRAVLDDGISSCVNRGISSWWLSFCVLAEPGSVLLLLVSRNHHDYY